MKKTLKKLILCGMIMGFCIIPTENLQLNAAENNVPAYYYANYKFADDWDSLLAWFTKAKAKYSLGQEVTSSEFTELAHHFDKVFPNLTKDYASVYEKCTLLANSLAKEYSYSEMEALMGNSCYKSLSQAINRINSSYTVKPSVGANPSNGMAPLTVTFDARNSSDPSLETIPSDNFYWYYRDEKGVDRPIGYGQVLSYTFSEPGKFIVHLVVRSSNVDKGILDGERNLTINVTPKAADIVVYANTRRMYKNTPLKIGITEGERGVVFDGSLTKPRGGRIIESHRWTITNSSTSFSYDSKYINGTPSAINVPLKGNGLFKVTLTTVDNQRNVVSEDYYVYLSDPVTIIKQTPENGNTSTTFSFDGSASYSITSRLSSYVWEIFDGNGDDNNGEKITMFQGKKMNFNGNKKIRPGNYMVRLTVTDAAGNQNIDTKELYVESTTPTPQFTATATNKRLYPSEFTLDASSTTDIDVSNGVDSLEYTWTFSTDDVKILSSENNNEKIVVQFNEKGRHIIRLLATDQYGKFASVSKYVDIKSTLRPEIEIIPGPVTWGKTLQFKSSINQPVWDYSWDFGDGTSSINGESATEAQHVYRKRGIYPVKLTVTNADGEYNTINEKAFVGEIDYPIAAYNVTNDKGFYIQSSDTCKVENKEGNYDIENAYPVDRYSKFTINPGRSVNTKGTTNGLQYVFEKEEMVGTNQAKTTNLFSTTFNQVGCHYVDLTVKDSNVGKQDKTRIRFNVKNALPKLKNVVLSFIEDSNANNTLGYTNDTNSNKSIFPCSGNSNLTVKVTAVEAEDPDGNISRLRFYYYNIDDPDRILEYKETRISVPYVYFILPRISGEYKFGVMVYDNDGGMINSDEYLASNPSVYFSSVCGEVGVPTVTLKVSSTNVQVGDTVTYTIVSKLSTYDENFESDRTFYYDFEGDGIWDLVSKKDNATYTFNDTYEEGIVPRAAVEYRGKLGQSEGARILVKNGIKPVLLTNSCGNTVIFRDMSIGVMQQRQICFEKNECEAGNTKFRRTHISTVDPSELTGGSETSITQNDSFVWKYDNYGDHNVSIYLKNKYGIEVQTGFVVKTSSDKNNGRIAPGINMITIPETTLNNSNPEIFLSKVMDNTLLMYINNENGGTCYVDTDIATDSDGDGKSDNDMDIQCNKMAKIKYEPDYESAIGRVYFTNNGNLTFKNFYVTFEGIILELDDEKKEIYDDITTLVNGIEDLSTENTDLKKSLDKLRKNLNNRSEVTSLVITINEQIEEGGIKMSSAQKETLDSVISRLFNEDTIVSVGMSEYEKNKREIIALLPSQGTLKSTVEGEFEDFDENLSEYGLEERAEALEKIRDIIIKDRKKNKADESLFTPYFCNMFEHFSITTYTDRCGKLASDTIEDNYRQAKSEQSSTSEESKFPLRLKIILIVLVGGLLTMGGVILFFSIKARLNTTAESEDEEG